MASELYVPTRKTDTPRGRQPSAVLSSKGEAFYCFSSKVFTESGGFLPLSVLDSLKSTNVLKRERNIFSLCLLSNINM